MMDLQQDLGFSALWFLLEFNNVVYKGYMFVTPNKHIEIGELFSAFSIHEKHQMCDSGDLSGEIVTGGRCSQVLKGEFRVYQGAELPFATFP